VIGIVGAGVQGRYNLLALKEVLSEIQVAKIFDTNEETLLKLISSLNEHLPFRVEAGQSIQDVIEGANVIVTATGHLEERIFKEEWVGNGALVLPIHTRGWEREILSKADKFIVDDWQQFSENLGQPGGYYSPLPDLYSEIGEIVIGKKPGREDKSERIIDINRGIVIHDVAVASVVLARAKEKGIGTKLDLMESEPPLLL
jgi:ornithine cyclodeaminase/alanine dehydrogenase-like protein (mu-crystallin family)